MTKNPDVMNGNTNTNGEDSDPDSAPPLTPDTENSEAEVKDRLGSGLNVEEELCEFTVGLLAMVIMVMVMVRVRFGLGFFWLRGGGKLGWDLVIETQC